MLTCGRSLGIGPRDRRPRRLHRVVQSGAASSAAAWPLAFATARGTPVLARAAARGRLSLFARARALVVAAPTAARAPRHGSGKAVAGVGGARVLGKDDRRKSATNIFA